MDAPANSWSEDAEKAFQKGGQLLEDEKYEEALEAFDRALELCPHNAEFWNDRGVALWKLGRNEEALESYNRALQIDPEDAPVWYNKSTVLREFRRDHEAKKALDRHDELVFGE